MSIPRWEDAAEDEFWERVPTELHQDAVRGYLGTYGDAIDERVCRLETMASDLFTLDFYGPSIVASLTAIEVMIQFFCVRPIIQSVFLSDLIASEVAGRIIGNRYCDQKTLLVPLLRPWGIDLTGILLPDGASLWERIQTSVNKGRNNFVHRGDVVSKGEAALALECVRTFRKEVVSKIASSLKFTIEKSGCWSKVLHDPIEGVSLGGHTLYTKNDPFI